MPHDTIAPTSTSTPAARPEPLPRSWRAVLLVALVALTSLAVGATTSPWLVPPYLAAMAWLLMAPAPGRGGMVESPVEEPAPEAESDPIAPEMTSEPIAAEPPPPETPPKPKRKRASRARTKPKAEAPPAAPPTVATWVQVAPGKFVRVEVPAPEPEPVASTESEAIEPAPEVAEPMAGSSAPDGPSVEVHGGSDAVEAPAVAPLAEAGPIEAETATSGLVLSVTTLLAPLAIAPESPPCEAEPIVADDLATFALPPAPRDVNASDESEPATEPEHESETEHESEAESESEAEPSQDPETGEAPGEGVAAEPLGSTLSERIETRLVEDDGEPPIDLGSIEESPFDGRLVAMRENPARPPMPPRYPCPRLAKLRRDPRPKPRRLSGRVGSAPRVVLHRT